MRVCLGGTFSPFHRGHEALLDAALDATELFVGVTDGPLAARPDRALPAWETRAGEIRAYLKARGFAGKLTVRALTDSQGPARNEPYDAIVVSSETVAGAEAINVVRRAAKLEPLAIRQVSHVLAADALPISATRIAAGDIDRDGQRLTPVRVAVGSQNPVKVAAVEAEMAGILGIPVAVQGVAAPSGVPEQPKNAETMAGASQRAASALAAPWGGNARAEYGVGVEAGLQQDEAGAWYDVQACAIVDGMGATTRGWGPAFQYPAWVTKRALAGEMISDILGPVANDPRIGGTTGAIGFLTNGRMDRTALTAVAVRMAFVPRIRRALYEEKEG